jgi:arylsulfatase A-like enzyme
VNRLRIAFICGLAQWALLVAIQTGNFYGCLLPPIDRDWDAVSYFFTVILFIQAQNALVAAIFGIVAYLATATRFTSWLFFVVYVVEAAGLLVDQVYYKVFLDHIHLGMFEGGQQFNPVITFGSFQKEVDWIFYGTAVIALAGSIWFGRALVIPAQHPRKLRRIVEVAAIVAAIGIPAYSSKRYEHLNENPIIGLIAEVGQGNIVNALARQNETDQRLPAGNDAPVDHDPRLSAYLAASQPRNPQPNLVLIVMESVGALNLLGPDGLPQDAITPNLASLAREGVIFNSLYTSFPGTTRSLISLHTGGQQLTYGGMSEIFRQYEGPLLARAIGDAGYATALFSSERLDGEGTDIFLEHGGYQKFYDFARDIAGHDKQNMIHSWGAREGYTLGLVKEWLTDTQSAGKPFYLEYMTVATHHPYGAPAHLQLAVFGKDRPGDYLNALHYSDQAIGELTGFLEQRGLLKNTIIAVTGDHGEAFGDRHSNNFLHKNFTYEENVREFLLLWDGQRAALKTTRGPIVSGRIAKNGDIMPTLLALLGTPAPDLPGRNLLVDTFQTVPEYFHKLAPPETWGVRDGQWKYIGEIRSDRAELFNLRTDPAERANVAAAHPDLVAQYRAMCLNWYLKSERDYTMRLEDYKQVDTRLEKGDTQLGPRILSVGYRELAGTHWFVPSSLVNPEQPILAWTKWATDVEPGWRYEWISPDGEKLQGALDPSPEWHVSVSRFPGKLPMEAGAWTLRMVRGQDVRLTTKFSVSPRASLHRASPQIPVPSH